MDRGLQGQVVSHLRYDADAVTDLPTSEAYLTVAGSTHFKYAGGNTHDVRGRRRSELPMVCIGEGLWLWVTEDGTLIPG